MTFQNGELEDYELAVASLSSDNLPKKPTHYDFIMIDGNCDHSIEILKFIGTEIDDYSWIIWSVQSNQVVKRSWNQIYLE